MTNINLSEWNRWYEKYVDPIFKDSDHDEYYENLERIQAPFYPKYWIAKRFYEKIKNDIRFDDEIKKFFSFLYSCGFFMEYIISFEDWLSMPNWRNPSNHDINDETILEILEKPNGLIFLKNQLRWFPFTNRANGN